MFNTKPQSCLADRALKGSRIFGSYDLLAFRGLVWLYLGCVWIPGNPLLAQEKMQFARADIVNGTPYGVGVVELSRQQSADLGWHSDQTISLKSEGCKIWLPAVRDAGNSSPKQPAEQAALERPLLVYFMYSGQAPTKIDVSIGAKRIIATSQNQIENSSQYAVLRDEWWQALCDQSHQGLSTVLSEPTEDFLEVLGSHLKLPVTKKRGSKGEFSKSELKNQFERTLGMLLGFESVRLAMMIDETPKASARNVANQSLPLPVNVAGVRLPNTGAYDHVEIETIATMVPSDCFYVRCKSLTNYMWLRKLFMSWGGSLDEIVSSPVLESNVRGRLEAQLGIDSQLCLDTGLDQHLSDLAIIGNDVFFAEGAGIGVLLLTNVGSEKEAERTILAQRASVRKKSSAIVRSESIQGHNVSVMESKDHSIRSFFVRNGRFLLVTNSRELAKSFLSVGSSNQSLANLHEYRYANMTSSEAKDSDIKLYLSDPFFRRITSPAFRVELDRRRMAAKDCRHLEVAALIARSLGHQADSVSSLALNQFVSQDFGTHADGSRVELVANDALDSVRGRVGTFVPVADIPTDKVNFDEAKAYESFTNRYRREWPAMDPVLACIRRSPSREGVERVHLNIHVTPYARQAYAFLANCLAIPTSSRIGLKGRELFGVTAHLRGNSQNYLAHLGLSDAAIGFQVKQGQLQRSDDESTRSLVEQRSFAAVTPAGLDGLQLLEGLVKSLQTRDAKILPNNRAVRRGVPAFDANPFRIVRGLMNPAEGIAKIGDLAIFGLIDIAKASSIYQDQQWSIYGSKTDLRHDVRNQILQTVGNTSTQIHLHAGGVEHSDMGPYLHAYSFCDARQRSGAIAAWLTRWTTGLNTNSEICRSSIEKALRARLICPLGGEFIYQNASHSNGRWISTAWQESSLASVKNVPAEYRFPFLQWLKNLELNFDLKDTSLHSAIVLDVASNLEKSRQLPESKRETRTMDFSVEPQTNKDSQRKVIDSNVTTIVNGAQSITNVAHLQRGEQAITVGFDRLARVWDIAKQTEVQVFSGHQSVVWTVAVSPDSTIAATGSEDKTLRFWDVISGRELGQFSANGIFSCVRFSSDGRQAIATNWDGKVRTWSLPEMKLQNEFSYGVPTLDVALFPDGNSFVASTASGQLLLCDLNSGAIKLRLEGHTQTVHSVAVVDSNRILSASHDTTLRLWDAGTGLTIKIYRGHVAEVHEVRMLPEGNRFVSCSSDGTVRLWDLTSEKELKSESIGNHVRGISVIPDGSSVLAASFDGSLRRIQWTDPK